MAWRLPVVVGVSDLPGTPINRLERDGDQLRVVVKGWMPLTRPDKTGLLAGEHRDLFVSAVRGEDGPSAVRVGTATYVDGCEGYHIHGGNGIYAEVPLEERPLTDAEREWCDETFMFGGDREPDSVYEFTMPAPENLRAAVRDGDLGAFGCLDAVIDDADHRHRVLTGLQESIETENLRASKLAWDGTAADLLPEWDPKNDHNDGKSRAYLQDMASMRKDAHLCDFSEVAGFEYSQWFTARRRMLGISERHLDYYEYVAFDVAGAPDWTYCQRCAGVLPEKMALHVAIRHKEGKTRRVCEDCLTRCAGRIELPDGSRQGPWTEEAAGQALDERAQRTDGQRTVQGEYE